MGYSLLAVVVIVAMFAVIPLIAWTARGRWRDAVDASKGLGWALGVLFGIPAAVGIVLGVIGAFLSA